MMVIEVYFKVVKDLPRPQPSQRCKTTDTVIHSVEQRLKKQSRFMATGRLRDAALPLQTWSEN